ncbi:LytR/AlgR family response regulator transcription factor [Thiohalospira sp.]|uniref:LytR/AlgR family response regulator transcription factor n=1 Tax=Thiohalospira sp. TaxID=3080549 RepID=UPI00397EC7EA
MPPETTATVRPPDLGPLEDSPVLVAVVDGDDRVIHRNGALSRRPEGNAARAFTDLFRPWARERLAEEGLPSARREGLWEGEASLNGAAEPMPVHVTLVAEGGRDTGDGVVALMVPRHGPVTLLADEERPLERLAVPVYQETRFLDPGAIDYLAADGHYTRIHGDDGVVLASEPLGALQRQLPTAFLRVHRSYLVNAARIVALAPLNGGHAVRLRDEAGPLIPVSRRRMNAVREILGAV